MTAPAPRRPPLSGDPDWARYAPDRERVLRLRRLGLDGAADELAGAIELDWRRAQRRRIARRFGLERFGPEAEN